MYYVPTTPLLIIFLELQINLQNDNMLVLFPYFMIEKSRWDVNDH